MIAGPALDIGRGPRMVSVGGVWPQPPVEASAPPAEAPAPPAPPTTPQGRTDVENTYTYDKHRYLFDVIVPGAVALVALPAAVIMLAVGFLAPIALVVLIVAGYTAFNTFVAKCYPRQVTLTAHELVLESFGRRDVYLLAQITRMPVRENGRVRAAYIRVNGGGVLRGRYFVGCGDMYTPEGEKAEALYQFFLDTEARLDPDNIRVRARRVDERHAHAAELAERSEEEERAIRAERRRRRRKGKH